MIIPESLALKLFGSESPVDKLLKTQDGSYLVGGVYVDFPPNTTVKNAVYIHFPVVSDGWTQFVHGYVKVGLPEAAVKISPDVDYPEEHRERQAEIFGDSIHTRLFPVKEVHFHSQGEANAVESARNRRVVGLLSGIACLILVIAGINFANFTMALAPMRIKSVNTQKVLGASSLSLRWWLLSESVITSLFAFVISLILVQLVQHSGLIDLFKVDLSLSHLPEVFYFTLAIAVAVGFLAGFWPSWYVVSISPALALKGVSSFTLGGLRFRNLLIGFQFIIAQALVMVMLVIHAQNFYMLHAPLGFDKERIVVIDFDGDSGVRFWEQGDGAAGRTAFADRVKSYAGCETFFTSNYLFLAEKGHSQIVMARLNGDPQKQVYFWNIVANPLFIKGLGIKIAESSDIPLGVVESGIMLFNEKAKSQFGLTLGDRILGCKITGFFSEIKGTPMQVVPLPFSIGVTSSLLNVFYIKLKEGADEQSALSHYRQMVNELGPYTGEVPVRRLEDIARDAYEKELREGLIVSLLCGLSICIAVMGVFGLVAFESQIRRKEIGICRINGATITEILVMFNRTYLCIVLISFVLAAPLAYYFLNNWMERFYDRLPGYGWLFAPALLIVVLITVGVVTLQSWRAACLNPVESIKSE